MNASSACLSLIKRSESCRLDAYLDQAGVLTIGWGHTGPDVLTPMKITQAWADWLLRQDVEKAERAVTALAGENLSQGQFDALVCFVFNVGRAAFAASTLLSKLLAGDVEGAAEEFLRWDHLRANGKIVESQGLLARRREERRMFMG